jgi:D-aspartate ligase
LKFNNPAIVFGGGINGLGITRNLGRAGVDVYCVLEGADPVVFSRHCHKHFLIPNLTQARNQIESLLKEISKKTAYRPVIFATDDIGTLILSDLKSDLRDDFCFVMPDRKVAETLVIKTKFYESLAQNDVPHPRVFVPEGIRELKILSKKLKYPIFIRPSLSQHFSSQFHMKGFVAKSAQELLRYFRVASECKIDVMLQEIVPGPDTNIYGISGIFDRQSKPLAFFAYRRLKTWPPMFGNNSLIESISLAKLPFLKETVARYLERLQYYGIMEAEFKLDPRDNNFKLLEINARSWWQNSFPTKCGLNIILKAYLEAIGEKMEYSEAYNTGIRWVNFSNYILSSIFDKEITKRKWIKSFKRVRDFAYFDVSDPFPYTPSMLLEGFRFVYKKKATFSHLSYTDILTDGNHR